MVMFAETKAQQIVEDGLLSTEEKIAQLCELDARLDASRSVCNVAPCWRLVGLDALRKAFTAWVSPMSNRANCLSKPVSRGSIDGERLSLVNYRCIKPAG